MKNVYPLKHMIKDHNRKNVNYSEANKLLDHKTNAIYLITKKPIVHNW